jgi:neutral amino acid transport system permease protein
VPAGRARACDTVAPPMEAQTVSETPGLPVRERLRDSRPARAAARHPQRTAFAAIGLFVVVLIVSDGLHDVAQTGLNGLALGSVYALGAVGLTLVYGILKLVNFAHGEFLTFGAYTAFVVNVTLGAPLVLGVLAAIATTALLGVGFERAMWGPMRARKAGLLQLLLMAIGLAFLIRYGIQFFAGTEVRVLDVNRTDTVGFLGLSIGRTNLLVIVVGFSVLIAIGLMLKLTLLGKRMRALADDLDLAETAGIDTSRVILYTWLLAGGSAGLAGVLAGSVEVIRPELGFGLLLAIFAAVILGGIGDAFGALAGGLVLGVVIEWSTLFIDFRYKLAVGFFVLIIVLVVRPQGILGRARTV